MYLLDTNVFIEAKNTYYGFDTAPGFWEWVTDQNAAGNLASVPEVRSEMTAGNDDLAAWVSGLPSTFWLPDTVEKLASVTQLSMWAAGRSDHFRPEAISEFLGSADMRLIAAAGAAGHTVVSHERRHDDAKKKVPIPNACAAINVPYQNPHRLFRRLGLHLVQP
ncbi:MAG: DUF4411 family protein [Cellulomonadaceae bacterium]|jgi:hypothetical protein|nr:DUF4411 family protein [Cellulomonadaceae bacterium]